MVTKPATSINQQEVPSPDSTLFAGGGEMGARIRAHDWENSPLGAPDRWPQSLRSALELILPAQAQIVLFWGPEYVALYNDAYAPTIGDKHPRALGRPASEHWSELWDDLGPLLRNVRETGETFFAKDRRFYIERHRYPENVYFDISYSAVPDGAGGVGGVVCIVNETTKQVVAAQRLAESEERFRLVAESAPVMLWMGDETGNCAYLNCAQREFWGVSLEQMLDFNWHETVHPGDREALLGPFTRGMRERTGFSVEARYRRADGEYRTLDTDAHARFGADGEFLGMIGVNVDVTETRRVEAALKREARLLEIVNQTGADIAADLDVDRIAQKVTDAGVELTGAQFGAFFYNERDENGGSYRLYALSGVPREAFALFPMPRHTQIFGPTFTDHRVVRSDDITVDPRYGKNAPYKGMPEGHLPVRSYLGVPVRSHSGEVLGGLLFGHADVGVFKPDHETLVVGVAGQAATAIDNARLFQDAEREVGERRLAEKALQDLIEALPGAVYTTDANGVITSYNPAAAELWGRSPELGTDEWCGSWRMFWPDGSPLPHDECPMAIALKEKRVIHGAEAIAERPDGVRVPFLAYPTPLRNVAGEVTGAVNMLVDISERKRAEELAQRLAAIVESSDDAIVSKNLSGLITSWNRGAERLFGYSRGEVIGRSIKIVIPPDRHAEEDDILERVRRGEHIDHYETVRLRSDGSEVWVSLTISPLVDAQGRVVGASKIARDMSERRRVDEHRKVLMGELNHRVKNTLAIVQSIASQTLNQAATIEEARASFGARLINLSKAHEVLTRESWTGANLAEIVADTLKPHTGGESRFRIEGPAVQLSPSAALAVSMALHELSTNAAKYGALSTESGRVTIVWNLQGEGTDRRLILHWEESNGPKVAEPKRKGFGSRLIERALAVELGGDVNVAYASSGLVCTIDAPMPEGQDVQGEESDHTEGGANPDRRG